jgi:aspartate/methionine/tyrosine aminotransferase
VILDTFEAQKFQIDPERMEGLINERTRALILNTPNNPTGACFTPETLHAIADIAIRHDLIVIADDIYSALCYNAPFLPITTLEGMRERTITINSFSKNFVMTGWRIGNVIGPDYILKTIQAINENVMFTAPSISQRAALYAIRDRRRIQGVIVGEYKERVMKAASRIGCIPDMKVLPPESSFYLFINVKGTGLSSAVVADRILEEAHVLVLPGNAFGACGEGYVRIACTVPEERLMEAFDRIARMELFSGGKTARTSA